MQRQGNFKIFVFSSENERYEGCRTMETETVTVWDIQEFLQPQMITQCVENLHWLYHMVADGTDKIFTVDYLPVDYIDQLV
jgi:hypothetical protein